MKILLVRLGAIGDIVHSLPALAAIKAKLPESRIGWAVESKHSEILKGNPLIDHLIEVDTRSIRRIRHAGGALPAIRRQASGLREFGFDIAIDLQGLIKSAMVARLSGAKRRVGFGHGELRERASRIFLTERIGVEHRANVIHKNLELVSKTLGFQADLKRLEFPITVDDSHRREAAEAVAEIDGPFALLNPGGGWVTKLWPAENFGRLADTLVDAGITPLLVNGPGENALLERSLSASRDPTRLRSATPSLKGFVALAKLASVYVGGDTGPTHLAVAAGAPIVGIFGPTEWWRNGSPMPDDICVERTDIGCRVDCHRRQCSKWICMDIPVETVFDAVMKRIARSPNLSEVPSRV